MICTIPGCGEEGAVLAICETQPRIRRKRSQLKYKRDEAEDHGRWRLTQRSTRAALGGPDEEKGWKGWKGWTSRKAREGERE